MTQDNPLRIVVVRSFSLLALLGVAVTQPLAQTTPDCSDPNGVFPTAPEGDLAACDQNWGVSQYAGDIAGTNYKAGQFFWGSDTVGGYPSACWNALNAYYGANQLPSYPYQGEPEEGVSPLVGSSYCGLLNLETQGLAFAPPWGFAAPFNLLAPPGIGDFLPPSPTLGMSSVSLVLSGMSDESTWWNDATRQTLGQAVDLVTGLPLARVNQLELPFDGATFRLIRTRSGHRRDQVGLGAAWVQNYSFDYLTAAERWWDWSGQGWMMSENPLLIVDSAVPDLVGNNPRTTWLVLDAHHSIPFQQIESTGVYAAPPRFRAKLSHNGTWDPATRDWEEGEEPTQMDVYLYDGALKYTFVIIREDIPPHIWDENAAYGQGTTATPSSLHKRPFLTDQFPSGSPNFKSWNPFYTCENPGLGLPYLGLCVRIADNYDHTVEINYQGVTQKAVDYDNPGLDPESTQTDGNSCVECGQSCVRKGMVQSVKLKTGDTVRWSLFYAYRGFKGKIPQVPEAFRDDYTDLDDLRYRDQDLWGSYHVDRIYVFEDQDPEDEIETAAGTEDYFLSIPHDQLEDINGLGSDPLYDLLGQNGTADEWKHLVQNYFARKNDVFGNEYGVHSQALKLMTSVTTRTDSDDEGAAPVESTKRWVYHYGDPFNASPESLPEELESAQQWNLHWLSRIYTPEDVAAILTDESLGFSDQLSLQDLVEMINPDTGDKLADEPEELGLIEPYASYRFAPGSHTSDTWATANGSQESPDQTALTTSFLVNDVTQLMSDMRFSMVGRAAIPDERGVTRYYQVNRLRVMPTPFIYADPSGFTQGQQFVSSWSEVGEEMNYRSAFVAPYQWHAYSPPNGGWSDPTTVQSPNLTAVRWIAIIDEYADERDLFPTDEGITEGYGTYEGTYSTKKSQISRRVVELSPSGYLLRDRKWEFGEDGVLRSGGGLGEQFVYRTVEQYFEELGDTFPDPPAEPDTNEPGDTEEHDALSTIRNELLKVEYRSVGWSAAELIQEDQSNGIPGYATDYGFTSFTEFQAFHPSGESWADYDEDSEEIIPLSTRVQPVAQGMRQGSAYVYANGMYDPVEPSNDKFWYTSQSIRDPEVPSDSIADIEFVEPVASLLNVATIQQELDSPSYQSPPTSYRMQRVEIEYGQKLDNQGNLLPEEEQPVLSRMIIGVPKQVFPGSPWYYPVEREFYDDKGNPIWACTGQLKDPSNPNLSSGTDEYESLTFTFYVRDYDGRSLETVLDADLDAIPQGESLASANPRRGDIDFEPWPTDENGQVWSRIGVDPGLNYVTSFVYDSGAPGLCDVFYPNGRRWARRVVNLTDESEYNAYMDEYAREFVYNNLEFRDTDGDDAPDHWVTTSEGQVKDYRDTNVYQPAMITRNVTFEGELPRSDSFDANLRVSSTEMPSWIIKSAIQLGADSNGRIQKASLLERSPSGALLAVGSKEVNDLGEIYREQEIDGTITAQIRNSLGQTLRVYQGTEDRRWYLPQPEWGPQGIPASNMILLERTEYGAGVNDAWLPTTVRQYDHSPSWEDDRFSNVEPADDPIGQVSRVWYDWRSRAVRTDVYESGVYYGEDGDPNTLNPRRLSTTLVYLDLLDRPVLEVTYGSDPEGDESNAQLVLPGYLDPSTYEWNDFFPGLAPGESGVPAIEQLYSGTTGLDPKSVSCSIYSVDGTQVERRSYDTSWGGTGTPTYFAEYSYTGRGGAQIFTQSPGGSIEVTRLDSLGRVKSSSMMLPGDQAYSGSNTPMGLKELQRTDYSYDPDGNVVETRNWERVADSGTILDSSNSVRTRTVNWYDVQKRLIATADLGTEDGNNGYFFSSEGYVHGPSEGDDWATIDVPVWDEGYAEVYYAGAPISDHAYLKDAMVRVYGYDDSGNKVLSVDPEGVLTLYEYDATNRLRYKTENAADTNFKNKRMTGYRYEYGRLIEMNLVTSDNRLLPTGGQAPMATGDIPVAVGGNPSDDTEFAMSFSHRTRLEYGATIVQTHDSGGYSQTQFVNNKLIGSMHLPNEQTGDPDDDATIRLQYTYSGQIALRFSSNYEAFKYNYDDLGRLIRVTVGSWSPANPTDWQDIGIPPTSHGLTTPEPTEKIGMIEYTSDDRGNVTDVTAWTFKDENDNRDLIAHTRMAYDERDRLTEEWQLHGEGVIDDLKTPHMVYEWSYEPTDPGSPSTGHDRLSQITYPVPSVSVNPRVIDLEYGAAGSESDKLSRITRMRSNIGTPILADFEYSGGGRRVETRLKNSKIQSVSDYDPQPTVGLNGFDRFGRRNESRYTALNATGSVLYRANYTFDKVGNRISARIQQADVAGNSRDNIRSVVNTYDRLHRLIAAEVGEIDETSPGADPFNNPQIATGTKIHSDTWSLDPLGNWAGQFDGNGTLVEYGRHTIGQLDDFGVPWSIAGYADYDSYEFGMTHEVTQRDSIASMGIFEMVSTDANGDNPPQDSTIEPIYDGMGRTLFDGTYGYHYDAWGRVVQINEATPEYDSGTGEQVGFTYGVMLKHFVYDGFGRLIRTTSPYPDPDTADPASGGSGETRSINFFYDGARRVQEVIHDEVLGIAGAESSGEGELEQMAASSTGVSNPEGLNTPQSLEKGQNPDPEPTRNIHREYVWGPGDRGPDELLLQTDEVDAEYWCLMDGGGDLVALVDVDGTSVSVVRQWTYDAYGAILTAEHLGPSLESHVGHKGLFMDRLDVGIGDGTIESPRLVPYGHTVYQNRNRSYSPSLGRFLQPDPNQTAMALLSTTASHGRGLGAISIAFSMEGMYGDGLNLYQYLGSNPWTNSDPLGLSMDPFDMVDEIMDEHIGSIAAFASAVGAELTSKAIIAARIASYLPFPGLGIVGELALVALGDQTMEQALIGAAIGVVPGGYLVKKILQKTGLGKAVGRIARSAFDSAKAYVGKLVSRATGFVARKAAKFVGKGCHGCFTAATLVLTANGPVAIAEISEGQEVLAAPDDGLAESYQSAEVGVKIEIGEAALVKLLILHEDGESETINTTDEHPFHVADTGLWTRADQLVIGDRLSTITGTALLQGVVYTTEFVSVYNLSIPGSPTYYVGEHGVWVHNSGCPVNLAVYSTFTAASGVTKGFKNYWEAHHLIPKWAVDRFPALARFKGKTNDMPAIILHGRNAEMNWHRVVQEQVDAELRSLGDAATLSQIRNALSDYYSQVPEAAKAVRDVLK